MKITLRRSYERTSKKVFLKQGRYASAGQHNRAKKETKKLKTMLGCVIRDILRKCSKPEGRLAKVLQIAQDIFHQKRNDTNKVYSVHAPEVECIAKGKVHKKYEFGCKVSMVSSSKDNWILAIDALHGNPYDGHTLKDALQQVKQNTGWQPLHAYCDKGYRGVAKEIKETEVHLSGCGFNLRKLLRAFFLSFFRWLFDKYFDHVTRFIGPNMIQPDFESKLAYGF